MSYWNNRAEIKDLVGLTVAGIRPTTKYDDEIRFAVDTGQTFVMSHIGECCESVAVEEIIGDLDDLVGSPILTAEERTSNDVAAYGDQDGFYDSVTWTFYELRTIKGSVTIRWCGESNGYYSESVDMWWEE